jgi:cell division protein ZapA (FtsZ GTPase activity inhibitor)
VNTNEILSEMLKEIAGSVLKAVTMLESENPKLTQDKKPIKAGLIREKIYNSLKMVDVDYDKAYHLEEIFSLINKFVSEFKNNSRVYQWNRVTEMTYCVEKKKVLRETQFDGTLLFFEVKNNGNQRRYKFLPHEVLHKIRNLNRLPVKKGEKREMVNEILSEYSLL